MTIFCKINNDGIIVDVKNMSTIKTVPNHREYYQCYVEKEESYVGKHITVLKPNYGKENFKVKKQKLINERQQILNWFSEHDYYINKIVLGEWTNEDSRYISYIEQRALKRNRLDEIEIEINNIGDNNE